MYAKKEGKVNLTINWKKDSSISITQEIEFVVPNGTIWNKLNRFARKIIGHFSLFLVTGVFGILTLISYREKIKYLYALLINSCYGFLLGGISELLQLIPEGRACQFKDVLIDTLGYFIGTCIVLLILVIIKKCKSKKFISKK